MIISSRLPSEWLNGGVHVMSSGAEYLEGSPLDRNIFLLLILAGGVVVLRRAIDWGSFMAGNLAIAIFFAFTFLSVLWSDFPIVAFKRWHKVFGHIIMVLVILTDPKPSEAFAALLRRCAYVLLPYSVLYIKYFPHLGRDFDRWTGEAVNTGITTNKNALANLCQMTALYFLAALFVKVNGKRFAGGIDRYIHIAFLYMSGWLLIMAESSTATVATALGGGVIIGCRIGLVRRYFSFLMLTATLAVGLGFAFTDLKDSFLEGLGEDTTLTGRTELWEDLAKVDINPVVGVGFESFWLGERLEPLWQKYWWKPNQAHNGYFEMYLNLGWAGVAIMLAMLAASYRHARKQTVGDGQPPADISAGLTRAIAEYRMAFLLSLVAYNFTEATFKALHPSFFMFFLTAVDYSAVNQAVVQPIAHAVRALPSPRAIAPNRVPSQALVQAAILETQKHGIS
jgi:O-antigen ligase